MVWNITKAIPADSYSLQISFLNLSTKILSVIKRKLENSCSVTAALNFKLPRAHIFFQVDFMILFIFKCTLVELIAEFIVIIIINNNSNILCYCVNDAEVQAATKQRAHSTACIKISNLCFEHYQLNGNVCCWANTHLSASLADATIRSKKRKYVHKRRVSLVTDCPIAHNGDVNVVLSFIQ
jgi:hypothetical protein